MQINHKRLFFLLILVIPFSLFAQRYTYFEKPYYYDNEVWFLSKDDVLKEDTIRYRLRLSTIQGYIKYGNFQKGETIADIGTGPGIIMAALSMFYDSINFDLQDINKIDKKWFYTYLNHYNSLNKSSNTCNYKFIKGTKKNTKLKNGKYDRILLNHVFSVINEKDLFFKHLKEKLKPGGKLYIGTHYPYSVKVIRAFIEPCGYTFFKHHTLKAFHLFIFENKENTNQQNTFERAITTRDLKKVKKIIEQGANINDTTGGTCPLMIAGAISNNEEIIKYLLKQRANINQECGMPYNPSTPVTAWDINRKVRGIYKKYSVTKENNVRILPIFKAVDYNDLTSIKKHIENGLDLNIKWYDGTLLQHHVARNGNLKTIKYFVEQGIGLNQKDNEGMNFLMHAIYGGRLDVIKYLIEERKVDINTTDIDDMNVLMHAAYIGNLELVKYLVESTDINPESKSKQGKMAIDYTFSQRVKNFLSKK